MKIKPENRFWIAIYGFTLFIMLIAMGVFGWLAWTSHEEPGVGHVAASRPINTSTNSLAEEEYESLATFQPPAYAPAPGTSQAFRDAMSRYQKQDFSGAASSLRVVADANPDFTEGQFYLGVALLLSGDRIAGIQELRTITENREGPYVQPARFYLAKGLIAEHDIKRATQQLEDLIAQHGSLEKQATALLGQIRQS